MLVHNNRPILRLFGAALLLALATFPAAAHQAESTQPVAIGSPLVTATGTVAELTVNNQLTGATLRYFGLKVDQGGSYALTGTGLGTLSDGSRINVTGTLVGNVFNVNLFSSVAPADSPARATPQAKTKKTISGTLAVYHKDFFDQGRGEYGLAVREASGKPTQLNVAAIPDALEIGMLISADGTPAADGSLDTSSVTILAPAPAALNQVAAGPVTNNVLVLPIKFTDSPASDPFTVAAINTEFQTHVATYYQEVSYGQQLLNVTVANSGGSWLVGRDPNTDLPMATPPNCDYTTVGTYADKAATDAGYNVNNYQNRYYVMPSNVACGWAGLAYISWGRAWSNAVNLLWVYGHELGHNFGLWHAGNLTCSGQSIGPNCAGSYSSNEYGDPFDVMGNIYPGHFNSMQKSFLGWIPASSVKTHTSGTATYTLSPLETSGQSTYAVKIPASTSPPRTYWIEYRQPIGVDSGIASSNGAQIRVASPFQFPCTNCGGDDTQILDMTLGTPGNFGDAALLLNQTYTDATYGISVTVTGVTTGPAGTLTLSVTAPASGTTRADFNADGRSDILWRHASDGTVVMWLMNGMGVVSAGTIGAGTDWSIAGVGDFNGDGKADILWRRASDGAVMMWLMNGMSIVSSGIIGFTDWSIVGVGDFNGDGKADILWRHASDGTVVMWLMNGMSVVSAGTIGAGTDWSIAGVGDFNGDGKADILWRRASDGAVTMWLMNGMSVVSAGTIGTGTDWSIAGVGDFNGDGKADILWRRASDGAVMMWLMNGMAIVSAGTLGFTDWSIAAPK